MYLLHTNIAMKISFPSPQSLVPSSYFQIKIWSLTTVISSVVLSFLPGINLGYPQSVQAKSEVIAQLQADELVCYMQSADGRTVNLTALCGQPSTPSFSPPKLSAVVSESAKTPLSNVSYSGNLLSGQVTNRTKNTVQDVKVNYEVLDSQGNAIDIGFIYAEPSTIPPGGTASFSGITVKGAKVQPTFIDWSN